MSTNKLLYIQNFNIYPYIVALSGIRTMAFKEIRKRSLFRPWTNYDESETLCEEEKPSGEKSTVDLSYKPTNYTENNQTINHVTEDNVQWSNIDDPYHVAWKGSEHQQMNIFAINPDIIAPVNSHHSIWCPETNTTTTDLLGSGRWRAKKQRPKRFQCPHCHVSFSNNGQLKGHVRIHTGERPFACDHPECGKTFTRNEELTRHKRIHSGIRPFPCPLCGKRFGRKDHLKKHIKTHQRAQLLHFPIGLPSFQGMPFVVGNDFVPWLGSM